MKCARTVCTAQGDGMIHRDTRREYCRGCAHKINRACGMELVSRWSDTVAPYAENDALDATEVGMSLLERQDRARRALDEEFGPARPGGYPSVSGHTPHHTPYVQSSLVYSSLVYAAHRARLAQLPTTLGLNLHDEIVRETPIEAGTRVHQELEDRLRATRVSDWDIAHVQHDLATATSLAGAAVAVQRLTYDPASVRVSWGDMELNGFASGDFLIVDDPWDEETWGAKRRATHSHPRTNMTGIRGVPVMRLRGHRLTRQELGDVGENHCTGPWGNRHHVKRWLRKLAPLVAIASDALWEGCRAQAIEVLCELVHLEDAIKLTRERPYSATRVRHKRIEHRNRKKRPPLSDYSFTGT